MSESSQRAAETRTHPRGHLLRVLGVAFGIAVTVGNTIGAGLLRTAGDVAKQLPDSKWFLGVWALGGVLAILAAFSLAELATRIPRSGGHFVFIRKALGDYPGFVIGWTDWLSNCSTTSTVSIVVGEYMGRLIPGMAPYGNWVAIAVVIGFGVLHWFGVRVGAGFQNLTTAIKAFGFFALIAACFIFAGNAAPATPPSALMLPTGTGLLLALVLSTQAIIYTYDGFAGIIYFGDETKDPRRDIPKSIFGGTLLIIAIYLLTNAAIVRVLPISAVVGSNLAIGDAAQALWGSRALTMIEILIVVSLLAALNAYPMIASRILYTLGHDGLFWRAVDRVNEKGTPHIALGFCTVLSVLFILWAKTLETVLALTAFFFACNYAGDMIALLVIRRRDPRTADVYRAWGFPVTTVIVLAVYVAFLFGSLRFDWANARWSLLLLVATYPVFWLARRHNRNSAE
ncbi:MAG TPA: APC family permease [Terriglobales bacterium]|nr:APC family permease [Terriglobales bacterium]